MSRISVVGVPSSAGSYAAGQDQAPGALRSAGLVEALVAAGREVRDDGDLPLQVWRPDRDHPLAQNAEQVTACLRELAERLGPPLANGDMVLVLGGNCTIALAVIAALRRMRAGPPGLLYIDRHYDINTPQSTIDGALDWMGLAHALSLPGCVDALAGAFGPRPLLQPNQVAWVGVEPRTATDWEREQASRLGLHVTSSEALAADPAAAARDALGYLPLGPLAIHIDVDVLDFTDAPLAENTDGRNTGPTLDQAAEALRVAARDPRLRAFSIGELNPTRSAGDPEAIPRFVRVLAGVLAASSDPAGPGSREVVLRPAEPGDAPAMQRLAISSYGKYVPRMGREPAPMADDYAAVVARGHAWVAEHGDQLVGLLVLQPAEGHLLLENIAVAPSAQNTGLGSRLLRLAEQRALAMGLPEIRLYTNEAMTENLDYYPRRGYRETHRATQDGYQRVFFSKALS